MTWALLAAAMLFCGCKKDVVEEVRSISLSQTETYNFEPETTSNYAAKTPLIVTVTNTGNVATGKLSISADGASASSFALSATSIEDIAAGATATFTIAPVQNLAKGDYQANVHVSGRTIAEQTFSVRFVITDMVIASIKIVSQPTQTTYGVGEPFNVEGLQVVAVGTGGDEEPLEITADSEYLVYDFSTPSEKDAEGNVVPSKVQIIVGSAPVQEIDVQVLSVVDRIKAAAGTKATIICYADEKELTDVMTVNTKGSDITITTPKDSTKEVVLKRNSKGSVLYVPGTTVEGEVKVTLDGYITIKGRATQEFGGSDDSNNNNKILLVSKAGVVEMKGHSKLTCNAHAGVAGDGAGCGGGARISSYGKLILADNASITNCTMLPAEGNTTRTMYGGAFHATGNGIVYIKDNAKISGNRALCYSQNAYGGACFMDEGGKIYMEGGEISGNTAESRGGVAGGGAIHMVTDALRLYMSGGVIKDNVVIYKTQCNGGGAITCSSNVYLSGSACIEPKANGSITTNSDGLYVNTFNTVGLRSGYTLNIGGDLSAATAANLDLCANGAFSYAKPVIRSYSIVDGAEIFLDFTAASPAPASKFTLNNQLDYSATPIVLTSLSTKKIDVDGKVVDK